MPYLNRAFWTAPNLLTVPNGLTLLRVLLVPCVAWYLLQRDFEVALWLFGLAALTDLFDGHLARRLNQQSEFGAWLDPIADKLMLLTTLIMLAWDGLLPLWLVVVVAARDAVVVGGALAYRAITGGLRVAPSWLGKLATGMEFVLVSLTLAEAALGLGMTPALLVLIPLTGLLAAFSGLHYVWVWAGKTRRFLATQTRN